MTTVAPAGAPAAGLSADEAAARLARDGPNRLPEPPAPSRLGIFVRQFSNSMVALLAGAAAISLAIGEGLDAAIILAIVLANAGLGYLEEGRADDAAREIRALLAPRAYVLRDGIAIEMDAAGIVTGDLVLLRAGDRVPADGRAVACARLELDESLLTGESLPVPKSGPLPELLAGTTVARGSATLEVTATGAGTRLARIASSGSGSRPRTPLQERLDGLAGFLLRASLVICLALGVVAWAYGESASRSLLIGVSLAVAAIPEGLPAVVTVVLALGVRRMAERGAIIRRLPALETLGSTTVICSDKTGTLTENRMRLVRVHDCETGDEGPPDGASRVLAAAVLASQGNAADEAAAGPTEAALQEAAVAAGLSSDALLDGGEVLRIEPFDPERKRMSVLVGWADGRRRAYVKGAPEALIPLTRTLPQGFAERAERWAADGVRVLAVAVRDLGAEAGELERDLELVGLVGLADAPRAGARASVEEARLAGVRTIMITGDHPETARAIARATGIGDADVVTGAELDRMSDEQLGERCRKVSVFARVVPEHKLRIVEALERSGEIVAMTGDGVNDVPALRAAHIGVAMGGRGTDAATAAADMVLADDDYSTIVEATRRGRTIYDNVVRFVQFLLAANAGEVILFAIALAAGMSAPLTIVQILTVNLLTDGLPAIALGVDPPDRDAMRRPPRPPREGLLDPVRGELALGGLTMGLAAFASFALGHATSADLGRTMAFTTLVAGELAYVFAVRGRGPFFEAPRNTALLWAVLSSAVIGVVAIAVPPLMEVFDTVRMDPGQLAAALGLALAPFVATEVMKVVRRHYVAR